ncbi:hypothetical protein QIS99_30440 [Streptomyces sp. B-S-A8]|uniref:Uncharacterized protein n=1 Tax=Streptomyces solicavernae TaxID=3043614 RepID=A0ABT6S1L1_9ACTN|nr:hypothetical protein [Streptomyces sp. B-S-A8]MDI3390480.1 hypothetical protein [Streptomyces sp. B-S-A8]
MALITHHYLATPDTRYEVSDMDAATANQLIGVNTIAGFTPIVHRHTAAGEPLRTRDGDFLTVVALHGTSVVGVVAFEQATAPAVVPEPRTSRVRFTGTSR